MRHLIIEFDESLDPNYVLANVSECNVRLHTMPVGDSFPVEHDDESLIATVRLESASKPGEPTVETYAALGRYTAALLGSSLDWDGGDICEALADHAHNALLMPSLGDQSPDVLALWRRVADDLGIDYEDDDDEDVML